MQRVRTTSARRRAAGLSAGALAWLLVCAGSAGADGAGGAARAGGLSSDLRFRLDDAPLVAEEAQRPRWLSRRWRVQVEPMLWRAGLFGDLRVPGSTGKAELESMRLTDSKETIGLEAFIREGRQTFRVSGFLFSQSASGSAREAFEIGGMSVAQGEGFSASIDFTSFEATYALRVNELSVGSAQRERRGVHTLMDVYAGARAYDLRFDGDAGGGAVREDDRWVDIVLGWRMEMEITDEFSWDFAVDVGGLMMGDRSSTSVNVVTGIQWRPNERTGVQIGYRFMQTGFENGDGDERFSYTGSIAGLYGSVVFRF